MDDILKFVEFKIVRMQGGPMRHIADICSPLQDFEGQKLAELIYRVVAVVATVRSVREDGRAIDADVAL